MTYKYIYIYSYIYIYIYIYIYTQRYLEKNRCILFIVTYLST